MVPLMLLAQLYGVLQLLVLASPVRTIGWRSAVIAFATGVYASATSAVLLQLAWTRLYAALTDQSVAPIITVAGYTIDPVIEEVCKIMPLLIVCLVPRVRRQLGIADATILCAAYGSGFGLVEQIAHFSDRTNNAIWSATDGLWILPVGLNAVAVPSLRSMITTWIPSGVTNFEIVDLASISIEVNFHLVLSAIAGLGVGLWLRFEPRRWRWIGWLLVLFASFDHAMHNLSIEAEYGGYRIVRALVAPLDALRHLMPLYPLIAIGLAIWLDRRTINRRLAHERSVWFGAERSTPVRSLGLLRLIRTWVQQPMSLLHVWNFVMQRRAFVLHAASAPADPSLVELRHALIAAVHALEHDAPLTTSSIHRPPRHTARWMLALVLALPTVLYFGVGTFPSAGWVQDLLLAPLVFPIVVGLLLVSLVWGAVQLISGITHG